MLQKFSKNNSGVSNTVGVLLLVSLTVILAVIISNFVFGFTSFEDPINAGTSIDVQGSTADVQWNTNQNTELVEIQVNNNRVETLTSVGSTTSLKNLKTGDRISAVGIRGNQKQVLNSAEVTNGISQNSVTLQNTNLVKVTDAKVNTDSDGWSVFNTTDGSETSNYVTNSKLNINDTFNIYTKIPNNVLYRSAEESHIDINIDTINSGTPKYKIGYDYQSDTKSFNGTVLDQGELEEGSNNIVVKPDYNSADLQLVLESKSGIDVTYNTVKIETLVDARNIEVQYPSGNEWVDLYSSTETVYTNLDATPPTFNVTNSKLVFDKPSSNMFGEYINVSGTDKSKVVIDVEETDSDPTYKGKTLTQGENILKFNETNDNIHYPKIKGVKKINSVTITSTDTFSNTTSSKYPATIIIKNSDSNTVSGADVTVRGETKTTNENGEVEFQVPNNTEGITITHPDYNTYTDSDAIINGNVQTTITISK